MIRRVVVLAIAVAPLGCGEADNGAGSATCGNDGTGYDADAQAAECAMFERLNELRAAGTTCGGTKVGPSSALRMHEVLRATARSHANAMAEGGFLSHDGPDGRDPFDRMKAAGYAYSKAAENIARDASTPAQATELWLSDAEHCSNIMSGSFEHVGVGYDPRGHYWTLDFGAAL